MQTHWRLTFMFDARGGDVDALVLALRREGPSIDAAASGHDVRKGVAIRGPVAGEASQGGPGYRTVDGAIEVTLPNVEVSAVPGICRSMGAVLERIAAPGTIEVMTGAMHPMVPVRRGPIFLSLSFRRFPDQSVAQFREWWHDRHAPMAIPVLTETLLLAYDQVHVDHAASHVAADALGVASSLYDAYDNLTFESPATFEEACSDAAGMARLSEDEANWIDNSSRRYALMCEV